jgi:MCP family monocarboxylic acid transporter-like MFS transporter 10
VKDILPDRNGGSLVTCIAITSGIGRLIFGKVADLPNVNRILLQQISFVSIGICTMLLTAAPYFNGFQFEAMSVFALIMGLFDGCFITMLGPIAYDICGTAGASQAIGFLLGLCSIPLTLGPPIAGNKSTDFCSCITFLLHNHTFGVSVQCGQQTKILLIQFFYILHLFKFQVYYSGFL